MKIAQDALRHPGACAAQFPHTRLDLDDIVHARRGDEIDLHGAHREVERRRAVGREQGAVMHAERPQEFRASAFEEPQIVRVIDDAGKLWLANIATQRLDSIGALEGYSVNKRRFSTLLP